MQTSAHISEDIGRAVNEQLTLLGGMITHQKSLTVCVRYRDHSVTNELVHLVRACLVSLLEKRYPGRVTDRFGEIAVGKCTLRVRAADATKTPDLIITVDPPESGPAADPV